jgi:hypothetical protein
MVKEEIERQLKPTIPIIREQKQEIITPKESPRKDEIQIDDSKVLLYCISPKVESVVGDSLLISGKRQNVIVLYEYISGKVNSEIDIPSRPIAGTVDDGNIVLAFKEFSNVVICSYSLPLQLKRQITHPLTCISPSCMIVATSNAIYTCDTVDKQLEPLGMKMKWISGNVIVDNDHSVFIGTMTRLRRYSKSKNSSHPTWEHIPLTKTMNNLMCNNEYVVYTSNNALIVVNMQEDVTRHQFNHNIISVVLGLDCYVLTNDGTLYTINLEDEEVIGDVKLEEYANTTGLFYCKSKLYYSTRCSIRRFSLD